MGHVGTEFETWFRGVHPRLLAALVVVCGDIDVAEDCAAEALAKALERWDRVAMMASPDGWVFQSAFNLLRRRARRAAIERRLLQRMPPVTPVPPPAGEAWAAVRDLPLRQRTAVALRYLADLPEEQIAQMMGIRRSTVAATLGAARRSLATILNDPPPEVQGA